MTRKLGFFAAIVAALAVGGGAFAAAITTPEKAELPADEIAIGSALGKTWYLGGLSGLYPVGSSGKEFWSITDRGPNLDTSAPCAGGKQYPLPGFAPALVRIGMKDSILKVKETIDLSFPSGPATGLSVRPTPKNEAAYGPGGCGDPLTLSSRGVDSEGVVVDPRDDSFWIADEYLPSIMHVTSGGTVEMRIVPAGTAAFVAASGTNVVQAFPALVGSAFRPNRGFEDVAISPDGHWLYTALQSPMDYRPPTPSPDPRNSLAIRVFRIDVSNPSEPVVDREWVYGLDPNHPDPAIPGDPAPPTRWLVDKVSALVWDGPDRLLVEERDDPSPENANPPNTVNTRLYRADFSQSTNVLGTAWDLGAVEGKTLEQWYIPGAVGAPASLPAAAPKCLWADVAALLASAGFSNGKIEGTALIGARGTNPALLAVLNDNDFGILAPTPGEAAPEQLDVLDPGPPSGCTPS